MMMRFSPAVARLAMCALLVGMNGYALATLALERRPGIRILLTSGFPGDILTRNGNHAADWRLLSKPYRRDELAGALRTAPESESMKPDGLA